jgi:hypothetical protein
LNEPRFETRDILFLFRRGREIAHGLTEDDLYRKTPSLRHDGEKVIIAKPFLVSTADGTVWDWSKHGGHSFNPKIHWDCPRCGQQWWTDFIPPMKNPDFEGSGCKCAAFWLASWNEDQADKECSPADPTA